MTRDASLRTAAALVLYVRALMLGDVQAPVPNGKMVLLTESLMAAMVTLVAMTILPMIIMMAEIVSPYVTQESPSVTRMVHMSFCFVV